QEILQEVFLKVWNYRDRIDIEKPFQAFLFQIMRNSVLDFFRKASRDKNIHSVLTSYMQTDREHRNSIEDQLYFKEATQEIEQAINALPPKCREVFILCKIEGKSYEEVANHLKISIATVNNH